MKCQSVSDDAQEMPHSQSTTLLRHQKDRCGINKDITNATWNHGTIDAQTMSFNRETAFGRVWGLIHHENIPI